MGSLKEDYDKYMVALRKLYRKVSNAVERTNPSSRARMTTLTYNVAFLTHMLTGIRYGVSTLRVLDYNRTAGTLYVNGFDLALPRFFIKCIDKYLELYRKSTRVDQMSQLFPLNRRSRFEEKFASEVGMSITLSTKIIAKLYIARTGDVKAVFRLMGLKNAIFNSLILKELEQDGYTYDAENNVLYFHGNEVKKRGFSEPVIKKIQVATSFP